MPQTQLYHRCKAREETKHYSKLIFPWETTTFVWTYHFVLNKSLAPWYSSHYTDIFNIRTSVLLYLRHGTPMWTHVCCWGGLRTWRRLIRVLLGLKLIIKTFSLTMSLLKRESLLLAKISQKSNDCRAVSYVHRSFISAYSWPNKIIYDAFSTNPSFFLLLITACFCIKDALYPVNSFSYKCILPEVSVNSVRKGKCLLLPRKQTTECLLQNLLLFYIHVKPFTA